MIIPDQFMPNFFTRALALMQEHEPELGRLDAVAGDGDHGSTMVRGLQAAEDVCTSANGSPGARLAAAGMAFSDAAGGAAGVLFGMFFVAVGQQLGGGPFDTPALAQALQAGLATVKKLGKAEVGDKTMVDTLAPFVEAFGANPELPPAEAWSTALAAAEAGAAATAEMTARRGRAAKLGERSRGERDAGAVSMLYLLRAAGDVLAIG